MPRNTIDFSLGKSFGNWEIKANLRDLLAEKVIFKQIDDNPKDGIKKMEEVTKSYRPGRNYGLTLNYRF